MGIYGNGITFDTTYEPATARPTNSEAAVKIQRWWKRLNNNNNNKSWLEMVDKMEVIYESEQENETKTDTKLTVYNKFVLLIVNTVELIKNFFMSLFK
jgi:hypothetical protein